MIKCFCGKWFSGQVKMWKHQRNDHKKAIVVKERPIEQIKMERSPRDKGTRQSGQYYKRR